MTAGKDESMSESKMLAVMGSGGCGKTTLCCKLAARLAEKRRNVIVVCCDPFTPVSYTHLDVYKRQMLMRPAKNKTDKGGRICQKNKTC